MNQIKDEMDNLFNVGVGNQMEFVGFYKGEDGNYIIDRTDGHSYTDDYLAESKIEAINLLFEKVEEMIDDAQSRLKNYYSEIEEEYTEGINNEEIIERLEKVSLTALYKIQRTDLKSCFNEDELQLVELKHNKLVERYGLKEVKDISFNYYIKFF